MALAGSGNVLADARKAAKDSVSAAWAALNRTLTPGEVEQMMIELERADSAAIVAHIVATATVTGTATGAMAGGPGVPLVGTVS
jgi:hypothetical protein